MSERDPRSEPRPGDVLRVSYSHSEDTYRRVTRIIGHRVEYVMYFDPEDENGAKFQDYNAMWSWGAWAKNAEVLIRAMELGDVYHSVLPEPCD